MKESDNDMAYGIIFLTILVYFLCFSDSRIFNKTEEYYRGQMKDKIVEYVALEDEINAIEKKMVKLSSEKR